MRFYPTSKQKSLLTFTRRFFFLSTYFRGLGSFSKTGECLQAINAKMEDYQKIDPFYYLIQAKNLNPKGDFIRFASDGPHAMGVSFAKVFLQRGFSVVE